MVPVQPKLLLIVTAQLISVQLPNQIGADEERCLGVSWDVKNDALFIKSNLDKPGKKTKQSDFEVIFNYSETCSNITSFNHLITLLLIQKREQKHFLQGCRFGLLTKRDASFFSSHPWTQYQEIALIIIP